jgi:hypothetical protein
MELVLLDSFFLSLSMSILCAPHYTCISQQYFMWKQKNYNIYIVASMDASSNQLAMDP